MPVSSDSSESERKGEAARTRVASAREPSAGRERSVVGHVAEREERHVRTQQRRGAASARADGEGERRIGRGRHAQGGVALSREVQPRVGVAADRVERCGEEALHQGGALGRPADGGEARRRARALQVVREEGVRGFLLLEHCSELRCGVLAANVRALVARLVAKRRDVVCDEGDGECSHCLLRSGRIAGLARDDSRGADDAQPADSEVEAAAF